MKIETWIDERFKELQLIVASSKRDEQVSDIVRQLKSIYENTLVGYQDYDKTVIPVSELIRVYSMKQKVYAQTTDNTYTLHMRLYEVEELLIDAGFVRISNSELVNQKRIKGMSAGISGSIGIELAGGIKTYTSRRYMSKIRKLFGV